MKKFSNLEAALAMQAEGKYLSALYYCDKIQDEEGECLPYVSVLRGDIYFDMGLTSEAVREFMRAYSQDRQEEGAIEGLIDCYKIIDKGAAVFYMAEAIRDGVPPEAFADDVSQGEHFFEMTDRTDYSEHIEAALGMIESGDGDKAREILDSIPIAANQYADSCVIKGTLYFEKGDLEQASSLAKEAIEANKLCVGAYILQAMVADKKGDAATLNRVTDEIVNLEIKDQSEALKAALALCNYGFTQKSADFIKKFMVEFPFDKISLLFLASLKTDDKEWKKCCHDASLIYRDDEMVKEVTSRLLSGKQVKIPDGIFEIRLEWLNDIKDALIGDVDIHSEQIKRKIKWLLHSGEDELFQATIVAAIGRDDYFTDILDDALIDPMVVTAVKRHILYAKFCDDRVENIKFVAYNAYREINISHPSAPEMLKAAYYQNCMLHALRGEYDENILSKVLSDFCIRQAELTKEQAEELSIVAVAELMHERTGGTQKAFNYDEEDYNKAKELLKLN